MTLNELIKVIEEQMNKNGETFDKNKKDLRYKDPFINIGYTLTGEGSEFYDFNIDYDEVFSRDNFEVQIIVKKE